MSLRVSLPRIVGAVVMICAACISLRAGALPMPGDPPPSDGSVDQMTGSARLAIQIEAAPGAGGFAPSLSLSYASQGGDSPYGVGFGLSLGPVQLGEIRLSTRFLSTGNAIYE